MLAFRVCRLGKGIAVKFASRYYDAVTVAVRPVAGSMLPGAARGYGRGADTRRLDAAGA